MSGRRRFCLGVTEPDAGTTTFASRTVARQVNTGTGTGGDGDGGRPPVMYSALVYETDVITLWLMIRILQIAPLNNESVLNYIGERVLGLPKS